MKEARAFTDIPLTRSMRSYLVIVQEAIQAQEWQCACCEEWTLEENHCAICGRWMCEVCSTPWNPPDAVMHQEGPCRCALCASLPREVQDAAYQFRLALNWA